MAGLFQRGLSLLGLVQVRHVSPVWFGTDDPMVARVYRQAEREFGVLAPPLALHAPAPEVLAGVWLMLRETLVVDGLASRPAKEAVAAAVSLGNGCPYCVSVHTGALNSLTPGRDAAAIARGSVEQVGDPQLRAVAEWARASGHRHAAGRPGPFPAEQAPELVGVAVLLHYLNRMVNVFLHEAPMPPWAPSFALGPVKRVLGSVMRRAAPIAAPEPEPFEPGIAGLDWAGGNARVALAFDRARAAILAAGAGTVAAPVRELVVAELAHWDGSARGLSRSWVEQAVAELTPADRPAGRLALLMAFASYQVDRRIVDEYRAGGRSDRDVIELAAWASLTAALRIGRWVPATA